MTVPDVVPYTGVSCVAARASSVVAVVVRPGFG